MPLQIYSIPGVYELPAGSVPDAPDGRISGQMTEDGEGVLGTGHNMCREVSESCFLTLFDLLSVL